MVKNKMEKSIYDKNFKFEADIKPQHLILPKLPIKNDIFERVEDIRGDFKERGEDGRE
jgi:hypothetical protein